MSQFLGRWLPIVACLLFAGCALPQQMRGDRDGLLQHVEHNQSAGKTIYVVGHGWHTGIVLPMADVSVERLPETFDLLDAEFVEVGWGDEGFYRARKITLPLVFRAAFWPTPSVMHVAGFREPVQDFFPYSDLIEVQLSAEQFDRLCGFIGESFERDGSGVSDPLGRGLYGESRFYRARGKYYMPKTCNIWTARALRVAGLPIVTEISMTAESVLFQTRRHGRVLQQSPRGVKQAALRGSVD